jgi:glycine hydroxymethyltransferase
MKPEYFEDLVNLCTELSTQENKLLPLCAAENVVSPFSKIPLDTFLQEKYIMGGVINYQEESNFVGSKKLYKIYELLTRQCNKLYGCKYADARTLSGVNAVMTLLMSLFSSGDTILISSEECGGHGSMPKICHRLGINTIEIPYNYDIYDFDYEKMNELLRAQKINGILICLSDIIIMPQLSKIELPEDCVLIFDATQILGLIAAKSMENPLQWFTDKQKFILMGATHKTLPGPTCGLIMTNNLELANQFDTLINPDYLRNSQLHHIFSLILTLMELEMYGQQYCSLIVNNANVLAKALVKYDFNIIKVSPKYTYTHQIFISMPENDAEKFYSKCLDYGVSINLRNKQLYRTCGLRIGTQEISRYGWNEKEMLIIAEILRDIRDNEQFSKDTSQKINMLSSNKKICFTIENNYYDMIYTQLHHS